MNTTSLLPIGILTLLVAASPAMAQNAAPTAGTRELTLGASGSADKDINDSSAGLSFSYGKYTSDAMLWSIRQSVNYTNPENSGTEWNGSTRIAGDYHFGTSNWRPFLGANVGYLYGDSIEDTWAAGLETGLKYHVTESAFVFGMIEYAWLFDEPDEVDQSFDDGRYAWSVGVGIKF